MTTAATNSPPCCAPAPGNRPDDRCQHARRQPGALQGNRGAPRPAAGRERPSAPQPIASVRADLKIEAGQLRTDIAQTAQRQTTWLITVVLAAAAAGIVIAAQRLIPPVPPADVVRAIVEQAMRNLQPQPGPAPAAVPPPSNPQP